MAERSGQATFAACCALPRARLGEERKGVLVVDGDGRFVDASAPALDLFGVDLPTLRSRRVGDFTVPSQRDAVREAFSGLASGADGYAGEADIVRPDGTLVRIGFATAPHPDRPGCYRSVVRWLGPPHDALVLRNGAQVLALWREAERDVASHPQGSPERREAADRAEALRLEYQSVTKDRSSDT